MKKNLLSSFLLFILFSLALQAQEFSKKRLIVKYKQNVQKESTDVDKILSDYSFDASKALTSPNKAKQKNKNPNEILLFTFKESIDILKVIDLLKSTNLFEYVEPDYIGYGAGKKGSSAFTTTPNDLLFSRQWGLVNDGTFSLSSATVNADVDMDQAWDITTGDSNIIMAILDSGLRTGHPEFSGRIWNNTNEILDGSDSDSNGYADDVNGWDFANNDNNPRDDHGHGTNVAGIAVATGNNSIGYAGIDWNCKIMPLKILDDNNFGFYSWWIAAIDYAVNNGAKVINMSVGGSGFSSGMLDAVNNAHANDVVITVSMMNTNDEVSYYPAAYQNTIAVGSTDPDDERTSPFFWSATSGSNYGSHIDVVAPGNYIYGLSFSSDTNYDTYWGGTSQAAPLVAGICSLILDIRPNFTVEEVRSALRDTADDQVGRPSEDTPGWDKYHGAGRVNAYLALQSVLSTDDITNNTTVRLRPNPTNDLVFLSNSYDNSPYSIFNVLGKEVQKGMINGGQINLSDLNQGIYMVRITKGNHIFTSKVIKR